MGSPQSPVTFDPNKPFVFITPTQQAAPAPAVAAPAASDDPLAGLEPAPTQARSGWLNSVLNFAKNVGNQVNPLPLLKTIYEDNAKHPMNIPASVVDLVRHAGSAQVEQFQKAKESYDKSKEFPAGSAAHVTHLSQALAHTLNGALPLIGPALGNAEDQLNSGDISGGLGSMAGLALPFGIHPALKFAESVAPAVATAADRIALRKWVKTTAPRSGANATRFGDMAAESGPGLLKDPTMGAWSKLTIKDKVSTATNQALDDLNAIYDKEPDTEAHPLAPVKKMLQDKIDELKPKGFETFPKGIDDTKGAVRGTTFPEGYKTDTLTGTGKIQSPTTVSPANTQARLDALQQALSEVNQLGESANIDNIRKLAKSWSLGAKPQYISNTAADALKSMGNSAGWADADRAIRDYLVEKVPATKEANARYSLLRSADDAMEAAHSADQIRPPTSLIRRSTLGAAAGEIVGHMAGADPLASAAFGGMTGMVLDAASAGGFTTQIATARALSRLADTMRDFSMGKVKGAAVETAAYDAAKSAGVKTSLLKDGLVDLRKFLLTAKPNQASQKGGS